MTRAASWTVLVVLVALPLPLARAQEAAKSTRITGELKRDDPLGEKLKHPSKAHEFKMGKGQMFLIRLNSADFDAFLIVQDSTKKELAFNDDDPDDPQTLNSKLLFTAPKDDTYKIVVTSDDNRVGKYELMIDAATEDLLLAAKATKLNREAKLLFEAGRPKEAVRKLAEELEIRRKLYTPERFKDGHPDLATTLDNMGFVLNLSGDSVKALPYCEEGLAMNRKLYPTKAFPDGDPKLAHSLNNIALVLRSLGDSAKALECCDQGLVMRRKLYPPARFPDGHSDLAHSLQAMGNLLESLGESAKALPYFEQGLAMTRKLYPPAKFPDGHPRVAGSLNDLGFGLESLGESAKALPYYQEGLAMRLKLYSAALFPDGHPDLAVSLSNMGFVLESLGEPAKALPFYNQALAMQRKLYPPALFPDGHSDLAASLNNIGALLLSLGQSAKALPYFEQALAMQLKLHPPARFPGGHSDLAQGLNNMGAVLQLLGEPAKALPYYEQGLAMCRKLYPPSRFPDGHPNLTTSLNNMGGVLASLGEPAKALAYFEQGLAMQHNLALRETNKASEAQALAYLSAWRGAPRHRFLSVLTLLPPSTAAYDPLWHTRGGLLPLMQARHQGVLAQIEQSDEVRKDYGALVAVRTKIARLQSEFPNDANVLKVRDKELASLNDELDRLERKLAEGLPAFKHLKELRTKGPADLAKALAKDAAFVDLLRYRQWGKGNWIGQRYVAFVLLPGQGAKFLQLGDAAPIDEAARAWRNHIAAGQDSLAPAKLRELVWDKIAKKLPAATKRVYLCPDGELARVPFAALPGKKKDTILLEDYALATVPSGPWLLQQLLYPPKTSDLPDRLLAIGDVDYGQPVNKYNALPGTGRELLRVLEAFDLKSTMGLKGSAAGTDAVRKQLPTVQYAHFATHGYFDEKSLTEERQRQEKLLKNWTLMSESGQRFGLGTRHPAGFTGLVLAGANDPANAGAGGGILTGLDIVNLPLEKLHLCVLSACETGLGELTEAEGVMGLQRAFHAAGCPNVVGSLWRVDDEATAALMTQFYHELRKNKRSPLDALREAQLTLYRHPEAIPALAGSRGPVNQAETVKKGSQGGPAGAAGKTAPVTLWAAFYLSGVGQ